MLKSGTSKASSNTLSKSACLRLPLRSDGLCALNAASASRLTGLSATRRANTAAGGFDRATYTEQAVQPVHIRDVVDGVLACLVTTQTRQTLDIVGAETLTFKQWLHTLRAAQGLTPCPTLRIPLRLALAVAWLGHHFSPLLQPDNLRMLQAGYQGDEQAFSTLLGRSPLAFAPELLQQDASTAQTGSTPCSI